MSLPNNEREKKCYEMCEELVARVEQLGYVLEDIEVDHKIDAAERVNAIVGQLKEIQSKLAAIAPK